jgi:hypothetical protein
MSGKLTVNLDPLIDEVMGRHDPLIAAAEDRLCLALGANGQAADEAIADLFGPIARQA